MVTKPHASDHPPLFDGDFLRQLERLAILSRKAISGRMQGERRSTKRGQSVEFADFRPYSLGDDFRRIDWNAYARLERFFIKLFIEEEDTLVHLLLDTSASMDWGIPNKHQYSIRAAAALGYIALAGLDRVTVTALNANHTNHISELYFSPHRGKNQAHSLFSFLQDLKPGGTGSLAAQALRYRAARPDPGPLVLISDLFDNTWKDGLHTLASGKFEVTVLHLLAPEEVSPELTGELKLVDIESQADVEITADYDLIARYKDGLRTWKEEIKHYCAARGIHYV
ncbi:MAG TPA: DUF58 domain-containing protein, partial [Anaerolineales bacterium]|nr:DUF58 domain-containing protein [Anaerolineales bacterium]